MCFVFGKGNWGERTAGIWGWQGAELVEGYVQK
jgi:hypothetical protein